MELDDGVEAGNFQSLDQVTRGQLSRTLQTLRRQFREDLRRELREFFGGDFDHPRAKGDVGLMSQARSTLREHDGKVNVRGRFDGTDLVVSHPSVSPRRDTRSKTLLVAEVSKIRQVIDRKGLGGIGASSGSRILNEDAPKRSSVRSTLASFARPLRASKACARNDFALSDEEWPSLPSQVMSLAAKPSCGGAFAAAATGQDPHLCPNLADDKETQSLLERPKSRDVALQDLREDTDETDLRFASRLHALVLSQPLQLFTGFLAILNAIVIGFETDYQLQQLREPHLLKVLSTFFCIVFTLEVILKVSVLRAQYFCGRGSAWHIFEFALVCQQILDELSKFVLAPPLNLARPLRYLRIMRAVRIVRVLRSVNNFGDLPALLASLKSSLKPFFLSMTTVAVLLYTVAVCFADLVPASSPELQPWFGSVLRTMLTLYECMLSGVSWDEVVRPLSQVSPLAGFALCLFVGAAMIAVLNIVTGLFVDKAIRTADQAQVRHLIETITDAFTAHNTDLSRGITQDEFRVVLMNGWMTEYFDVLGIDSSEGMALFNLMDADGNGCIDALEFVSGCLRLRGPAKAMELAVLARRCNDINEACKHTQHLTESIGLRLTDLAENVSMMYTKLTELQPTLDIPKTPYGRKQK